MTRARLVEPPGVHLVFPRAKFTVDHVVVKRLADLDVRQLRHRALDVGISLSEPPVRDEQAAAGLDVEYERGAIWIVRLLDPRGYPGIGVAAPAVFRA